MSMPRLDINIYNDIGFSIFENAIKTKLRTNFIAELLLLKLVILYNSKMK